MEPSPKDRLRHTTIGGHTKQRLIGAIALVVIVVIVVPELLTGPRSPRPSGATPAAPVRTVTIDLAAGQRGAIARAPPTPVAPAAPAAAAGPAAPAQAPASAAAPSAAPAAAVGATPDRPAAPVVHGSAPQPGTSAPGAQGWIVQLGSFASRDNATHLVNDLRRKGYAAFVAEYHGSGRVLYRVRVGPEQERARADAIAQRLVREGYRGSVAPQP